MSPVTSEFHVLGLAALLNSISVYIGRLPEREGERGGKGKNRVKMSNQPPPAPTASAIGPCPTIIQIVGRPGTVSLPRTIAPTDHPQERLGVRFRNYIYALRYLETPYLLVLFLMK